MMRHLAVIATFVSALIFPWPLTALLAAGAAVFEPLLPLAVGIFLDALYYTPMVGWPHGLVYGLFGTLIAFFVRSRLKTSIIGE